MSTPEDSPTLRARLMGCAAVLFGFLILYDATNWLAHVRGTTRCMAFDWEFSIPRINEIGRAHV